jgi:hypothetical protein
MLKQQVFTSTDIPTLSNAVPAIKALHDAWSSWANKLKYSLFKSALDATTMKLNEYYQKTADSDAYMCTFTISLGLCHPWWLLVLHPEQKMAHFKKHWDAELQQEVLMLAQNIYIISTE